MASTALRDPEEYAVPAYEDDYAGWAHHQAMLLRAGQIHLLDRAWIAEELDDLGRGEYHKLESALRLIQQHMLKWDHQPQRRSRSWTITISLQRDAVDRQLDENPSLKPRRDEAAHSAYSSARKIASAETDLPLRTFPVSCPYDWEAIMTRPFVWEDDE